MSSQQPSRRTLSRNDLLAVFDKDPRRADEKYAALYQNLMRYFEWNRMREPEDAAQEALQRGFSRLQEGQKITTDNPSAYFFGIARNLVREGWKAKPSVQRENLELPSAPPLFHKLNPSEQKVLLRECLGELRDDEREMLTAYIEGEGESWSQRAGLQQSATRLRIHRIRKRLEKLAGIRADTKNKK